MSRILKYALLCLSLLMSASCIKNDLSYPEAVPEVTSFEVEGQKSVTIDNETRTIDIVMGEVADMSNVKVDSYSFTHDAQVVGGMPEYLDLRESVTMTLHVYEDFVWTINATQPIERYIRCENQIGEAVLDMDTKMAYVYVNEDQPLSSVKFLDVKLEPEPSVVKYTIGSVFENGHSVSKREDCNFPAEPMMLDCVVMRYFYVEYEGEEIRWSVKVLQKAVEVEVKSVTAWTLSALVSGMTNGSGTPVFEYRKAAGSEWIQYKDVKVEGTSVSADIRGLEEGTEYMVRLTNGELISKEKTFTTGKIEEIPNLNFDSWYMNGKAWIPNESGGEYIWDTANPGTAGLGYVPTTPETSDVVKGKAARLETQLANVLGIKKLAAGNIYTGKFGKIAGVGAELNWGVPFKARPLALKGYWKYSPKEIDRAESPYSDMKGKTDVCQVQIFLTDWAGPFLISTSKKQFVNYERGDIIARGEITTSETHGDYVEFTIPLVYRDYRIPTYVVISGAASKYGDYFTGGVGSVLLLDEFELIYDPAELTEEEYAAVFSKI